MKMDIGPSVMSICFILEGGNIYIHHLSRGHGDMTMNPDVNWKFTQNGNLILNHGKNLRIIDATDPTNYVSVKLEEKQLVAVVDPRTPVRKNLVFIDKHQLYVIDIPVGVCIYDGNLHPDILKELDLIETMYPTGVHSFYYQAIILRKTTLIILARLLLSILSDTSPYKLLPDTCKYLVLEVLCSV